MTALGRRVIKVGGERDREGSDQKGGGYYGLGRRSPLPVRQESVLSENVTMHVFGSIYRVGYPLLVDACYDRDVSFSGCVLFSG